jgi:hypothetical protein
MTMSAEQVRRIGVAAQLLLIGLCTAWAFLEKPAPIVNINWREGLSAEERRRIERDLYLEFVEDDDEGHYELGSPRPADIAAIVAHPDIDDTHRIDREHGTLSADSEPGVVRVWWAGPFKGSRGPLQFRVVVAVIAAIAIGCVWSSDQRRRARGNLQGSASRVS